MLRKARSWVDDRGYGYSDRGKRWDYGETVSYTVWEYNPDMTAGGVETPTVIRRD
jgi:hypothetical protein